MNLLISKSCSIPFGFSVFIPVVVRGALAGVSVRRGSVSSLHQLEIVTLTENLRQSVISTAAQGRLRGLPCRTPGRTPPQWRAVWRRSRRRSRRGGRPGRGLSWSSPSGWSGGNTWSTSSRKVSCSQPCRGPGRTSGNTRSGSSGGFDTQSTSDTASASFCLQPGEENNHTLLSLHLEEVQTTNLKKPLVVYDLTTAMAGVVHQSALLLDPHIVVVCRLWLGVMELWLGLLHLLLHLRHPCAHLYSHLGPWPHSLQAGYCTP